MIIPSGSNEGIGRGEMWSFGQQVMVGRWFSIFASFIVMLGAGGFYLFAYFSKDIKDVLNCDQSTLNKIGFYKDLGSNFGIMSGLLAEVAPYWVLLVLGATTNFLGYFRIWQGVTGQIQAPTVGFFCFYILIGGHAHNLANTAVLVTGVKNFPERRGVILGLLKGFLGLGGAVMTQIYNAIYEDDTRNLILLSAWFPTLVTFMFAFTIREVQVVRHPNEFRVFVQLLWVTVILAMFLTILIFIQKMVEFDHVAHTLIMIAIASLFFLLLLMAIREEIVQWNLKKRQSTAATPITQQQQQLSLSSPKCSSASKQSSIQNQMLITNNSRFAYIFYRPERGEDYTILQAIFSIDMLVLYLTMIIGIGSSLASMDNLAQIGESQGYSIESVNSFISLISIFNFAGRIFSGFVSEIMLEKFKCPRPLILTLTLVVSCIGHLLVAFPFDDSLYIASMIIGFSLGSQIPLYFAMISEIFGLKHYSMLYNFGQLSCPIGTYVLNVLVAGNLYDDEATKSTRLDGADLSGEYKCIGNQCFRNSFTIMTGLTLLGAGISLILVRRTTEFYRGDIYKKFKEDMDSLKTEVELYPIQDKKNVIDVIVHKQQHTNTKTKTKTITKS